MRAIARLAYRAILQLHPETFREEFGDEMLWVFDEETSMSQDAADSSSHIRVSLRLLWDGLRSAVIQSIRPTREQQPEGVATYFGLVDSNIPAIRFAQAGVLASCFFYLFILYGLAAAVVPWPPRVRVIAPYPWSGQKSLPIDPAALPAETFAPAPQPYSR